MAPKALGILLLFSLAGVHVGSPFRSLLEESPGRPPVPRSVPRLVGHGCPGPQDPTRDRWGAGPCLRSHPHVDSSGEAVWPPGPLGWAASVLCPGPSSSHGPARAAHPWQGPVAWRVMASDSHCCRDEEEHVNSKPITSPGHFTRGTNGSLRPIWPLAPATLGAGATSYPGREHQIVGRGPACMPASCLPPTQPFCSQGFGPGREATISQVPEPPSPSGTRRAQGRTGGPEPAPGSWQAGKGAEKPAREHPTPAGS